MQRCYNQNIIQNSQTCLKLENKNYFIKYDALIFNTVSDAKDAKEFLLF